MNEENNGFGPLAKRRGLIATYAAGFALSVVAIGFLFAFQSGAAVYMGLSFLAVLLGELFRRVFLLCEEFQHRHTRYEGKLPKIFKATFAFQHWTTLVFLSVISVAFVVYGAFYSDYVLDYSTNGLIFAINVFALPALLHLVGLRQPSLVEESELAERKNRNVADGLAWSYYFGYLKIVLPELKAQINDTGEEYRHKIKPHKLFILLPKNCYVRQLIKEADPNVQEVGDLKELKRNQAGIRERSYKHTVHKIQIPEADGGGEHHILVEYATPLKTLYDMSQSKVGALSREERDQQVMIFICKLKEILDKDKECRGKYELITLSGNNINIAEVLLRAINDPSIQVVPEEEVPSTHA